MPAKNMEELVALCKRRGFIFQSSEIYGGLQGTYDFGPLGVELKNNIPSKFLNSSARNIKHKKNFRFYKKFIKNDLSDIVNDKEKVAIITPDVDIIPGSQTLNPAYIVFSNYEKILKWNRSLRFALAVCTLKDKFKDEL